MFKVLSVSPKWENEQEPQSVASAETVSVGAGMDMVELVEKKGPVVADPSNRSIRVGCAQRQPVRMVFYVKNKKMVRLIIWRE